MRLRLLAVVPATAALAVPAAASAFIQVDRGIAGARLGNTPQQVRAALGNPAKVVHAQSEFGPYTEYHYTGRLRVSFTSGQVTAVSTQGPGDRTPAGIGVGSTEQQMHRRFRHLRCNTSGNIKVCHTNRLTPGARVTSFFIRHGRIYRADVARVLD